MSEDFQSGMPRQLRNYWIRGEGAAKIRWGTEGAFDRCVRNLTQESEGTIADVKGTCANLYHEATGKWPGANREEHDVEDLEVLVAAMGSYAPVRWRGPLAPISRPTDDERMFPPDTLTTQSMPAPLRFAREQKPGHEGAVTVGRIRATHEYTDEDGNRWLWGWGDFMNPEVIPEVTEAIELADSGVVYPSVDLVSYGARFAQDGDRVVKIATRGKMRAATLVGISAFSDLRLELAYPDDPDYEEFNPDSGDFVDADEVTSEAVRPFDLDPDGAQGFAVNSAGWKNAPIAPREAEFDADDAVSRIEHWAGVGTDAANPSKLASMFLWVNDENRPLLGREGYRLPWGDIIDGKPYLIYHAIYAAAALLSGGHGGLPNIPEPDKIRIRSVISDIYAKLAEEFGDPSVKAPWDVAREKVSRAGMASEGTEEFLGKYTESKHPRDPKGTEEGGEWRDVPGHGPHGQVKVNGKWVYPKRRKRTEKAQKKRSETPDKKAPPAKEKARSEKSQRASGTTGHRRTPKPPAPPAKRASSGSSSYSDRVAKASKGQQALSSPPVKLKRAPGGHHGDYEGEGLEAPEGAGSVRAISEMEGNRYQETNSYLWSTGPKDHPDDDRIRTRIAELDKTMDVSPLPEDTLVFRGIKHGPEAFGDDVFYGLPSRKPGEPIDFDAEDEAWDRFQAGHRPDLTGMEWTQKSYLHTTVNEGRLKGYAKKLLEQYPVAMRILLPKGTKGISMSEIDHEAEIMADRGLKLRVVRDNGEDENGVRRLDVEVVGGTR